tara:strand:- start:13681 stop:14520 length:840 start_codon:yes stop_codon:yes gene_type:complete
MGGLGNQLFQVAWGLYLKDIQGQDIKFDVSLLESKSQHNGIDFRFLFSEQLPIKNNTSVSSFFISKGICARVFRVLLRLLSCNNVPNFIVYDAEACMNFNEASRFAKYKNHLGYFQFPDAAMLIRSRIKSQIDERRNELFDCSRKSFYLDKVAIHVRRGDFLQSKNSKHQVFEMDYIIRAMKTFSDGTQFVVFSDDLKWCASHLNSSNVFFSKETSAYCDFLAMTFCKDYILTGSTFGFWAAFLSDTSYEQVVIIPKNHQSQFFEEENLIKTKWVYKYV